MNVIDEGLLKRFRDKCWCEWCGKGGLILQPHHLFSKGMGGARRFDVRVNLIALCLDCHARTHAGQIERSDLLAIVARREKMLQDDIEREIYRLRRL